MLVGEFVTILYLSAFEVIIERLGVQYDKLCVLPKCCSFDEHAIINFGEGHVMK